MLRQIATGHDLAAVAETLCRRAERLAGGVACSIMMVDESGNLHPLAAPSLPQDYTDALQGVESGPKAGSCGTATFLGHEVIVTDIATDPL